MQRKTLFFLSLLFAAGCDPAVIKYVKYEPARIAEVKSRIGQLAIATDAATETGEWNGEPLWRLRSENSSHLLVTLAGDRIKLVEAYRFGFTPTGKRFYDSLVRIAAEER